MSLSQTSLSPSYAAWQKAQSLILGRKLSSRFLLPRVALLPFIFPLPHLPLPKAKFSICINPGQLPPGVSLYHDVSCCVFVSFPVFFDWGPHW